jgi:hypothetical protein
MESVFGIDLEHTGKIDALIPEAVRYADRKVGKIKQRALRNGDEDTAADRWNQVYHAKMDKLAIHAGLRVG